ncbi:MAG: DUF6069 family protein [Bacteroidota bacterium]
MRKITFKSLLRPILLAAGVGTAINAVLYYIGTMSGIISLQIPVTPDGQAFSLPPVIVASIVPVFLAGLVYFALSKWVAAYHKWFSILAILLLLLSFSSPFSIPNVPLSMALLLNVMHLVVAGLVLYFFTQFNKKHTS